MSLVRILVCFLLEFLPMGAMYLNSRIIFNIARKATSDSNAVVATVFSVVFLETVINELAEIASDIDLRGEKEPQRIQAFAEILKHTEESRGSLELKYQLAGWILGGHVFDKGANPYQDFLHLVAVRNALVHMKLLDKIPVSSDGKLGFVEIPGVVQRLPKKVLQNVPPGVNTTWLDRIGTAAMAQWACDAASAMVQTTVQFAPGGNFKNLIEGIYDLR